MYDEIALPVRSKVPVSSRSQTRIYFVEDRTRNALLFIKWTELIACLLCLCFAIATVNTIDLNILNKIIIFTGNSITFTLVLVELFYPYRRRRVPLIFQVIAPGSNFVIYGGIVIFIYRTNNNHKLMNILLVINGFSLVLFLVDSICKIVISTYLYQTTRVKSVVDVAVSVFIPPHLPPSGKPKFNRTNLTVTPITYGGTFPVGKNQPPFLPEDRSPAPGDDSPPEKVSKHRFIQTPQYGDCKAVGPSSLDLSSTAAERVVTRNRTYQTHMNKEDKDTSTPPPFYLDETHRKKTPWTCSTPTTSRKIEARKQASLSTPITYSGTFAVNRELVPITPINLSSLSPKASPRTRKGTSRSEGNSPDKSDRFFLEMGKLDQISEEKISIEMSSENCSIHQMNLPGSVLEEKGSYITNKYSML